MNSKTAKDTEVVIIRVKRAHLFCFVANKGQLEKQDWTLDWTGLAEIRSYTVSYGIFILRDRFRCHVKNVFRGCCG